MIAFIGQTETIDKNRWASLLDTLKQLFSGSKYTTGNLGGLE